MYMNPKSSAREYAFQYLYRLQLPQFQAWKDELQSSGGEESLRSDLMEFEESYSREDKELTPAKLTPEIQNFAYTLVEGVLNNYPTLSTLISDSLKNWKLEKLEKVDTTVLYLGAFELCNIPDTPHKVVINEAIELARKYGAKDSGPFVNGVLDKIAKSNNNG